MNDSLKKNINTDNLLAKQLIKKGEHINSTNNKRRNIISLYIFPTYKVMRYEPEILI